MTDRTIRPSRFRARARWGDELVAESDRALRVEAPGIAPQLWFPVDDVRFDALRAAGTEPWEGGRVERFDALAAAPTRSAPVTWGDEPDAPADGTGLVLRMIDPPPGLDALAGHVLVDAAQAEVELVDTVAGDDPRDVTVKRFPDWGDAADLVAVLDHGAVVGDTRRPVVEASQLLGQAVVAAMRAAPAARSCRRT